jgi:nitroreductase
MNNTENSIHSRHSIRAYTSQAIDMGLLKQILTVAARAPSGTNMQPWKVHIITGKTLQNLGQALQSAFFDPSFEPVSEYEYYPTPFFEPYKSRRKEIGITLYSLLDIQKGDVEKMQAQHARNFNFFDAPVGLMFTINRDLKIGSWLDYGMFLQNIMILARSHGLDTCPQAAFAGYHEIIREHVDIGTENVVICGMAIGYADNNAAENQLISTRVDIKNFLKIYD